MIARFQNKTNQNKKQEDSKVNMPRNMENLKQESCTDLWVRGLLGEVVVMVVVRGHNHILLETEHKGF